jgi:MYXO-CTERM domain-containing protein
MATDELAHPGSVFRMIGCWIHDANGGNNVKSRAERNGIEGAYYHELELIGPDPAGGVPEATAREDSDVVGNVFVKRGANEAFAVVRFGGDGTGQSLGRYRFAFDTVIVAPGSTAAAFRLFSGLESVEMHGNVFAMRGGADARSSSSDAGTAAPSNGCGCRAGTRGDAWPLTLALALLASVLARSRRRA